MNTSSVRNSSAGNGTTAFGPACGICEKDQATRVYTLKTGVWSVACEQCYHTASLFEDNPELLHDVAAFFRINGVGTL